VTRWLLLLIALVAAGPPADLRDERILRVEQWLKATLHHTPGEPDAAAALVASWSNEELRALWIDASTLVALMRDSRLTRIFVKIEPEGDGHRVRYTQQQLQRLRMLACAASGKATWTEIFPTMLTDPACLVAPTVIDHELRQLSARAAASKRRGDANFFVRRAALLHADIAVALPAANEHAEANKPGDEHESSAGPRQMRLHIDDGRRTGVRDAPIHWMIGRMLLDEVRPPGSRNPAPGSDEMVRQWYRASIAWMQSREDYDTVHVLFAQHLFPFDADILFLAACQHETFAAPKIQTAARAGVVPNGFALDVVADREELTRAEALFRRVLSAAPDATEARLRLGHVLLRLGRYDDAAAELRKAVPLLDADAQLQYDGALFLGAAEERLGRYDAALVALERAASLYPAAQSPWLALSELAWRRRDRAGAVHVLQHLFVLPADAAQRDDPWWSYQVAQARNANELLEELRRPFRDSITP
jgi:tetratricopeptide (TPR) repeat protein